MAKRKVLVSARDALPEKKISISKEWMMEWLTKYGTADDVAWYQQACKEYRTMFQSNLPDTADTYDTSDWAKVRAEFLKRFFPNAYPKKPQAKKQQESYEDRLTKLLEAKRMEQEQVKLEEATADEAPADAPSKGRKK